MEAKHVIIAVVMVFVNVTIVFGFVWWVWSSGKKRDGFEGRGDPYAMYGGEVGYFGSL